MIVHNTGVEQAEEDDDFYSPASVDAGFNILSGIRGKLSQQIAEVNYLEFLEFHLRKRRTLFGRKKDTSETLRGKDTPISKSLLRLSNTEEKKAL